MFHQGVEVRDLQSAYLIGNGSLCSRFSSTQLASSLVLEQLNSETLLSLSVQADGFRILHMCAVVQGGRSQFKVFRIIISVCLSSPKTKMWVSNSMNPFFL